MRTVAIQMTTSLPNEEPLLHDDEEDDTERLERLEIESEGSSDSEVEMRQAR